MKPLPPDGAVHTHWQAIRKARLHGWSWRRIAGRYWIAWRDKWRSVKRAHDGPWIVAYMLDVHGVTESDVRDCSRYINRDCYKVRLWNWRTFDIDGLAVYKYAHEHGMLARRA